jgi:Zn finger protein HypA/HybF involved in hydrogenase expression
MSEPKERLKTSPICILDVDSKIRQEFKDETKSISDHEQRIEDMNKILVSGDLSLRTRNNLTANIEETRRKVTSISTNERFNFYVSDTAEFVNSYKNILREPVKMNFMGAVVTSNKETERDKLTANYLEVASKYMSPTVKKELEFVSTAPPKIECNNCQNKKNFDVDGNVYVCTGCGAQQTILLHTSSYKDVDRVNISTKYSYDRKVHFRDCINQYQGKQNTTIEQKIYDDLEAEFDKHQLLVKSTSRKERFQNIEKRHIIMFLKQLEYGVKHNENVNLIYASFTGKTLDDISHLESLLLEDFDLLTDLYDKKTRDGTIKIDRKSFINKHHVLYQLLHRHRHPCKKEDFPPLKTLESQLLHDDVCSVLFAELGWNYIPFLS